MSAVSGVVFLCFACMSHFILTRSCEVDVIIFLWDSGLLDNIPGVPWLGGMMLGGLAPYPGIFLSHSLSLSILEVSAHGPEALVSNPACRWVLFELHNLQGSAESSWKVEFKDRCMLTQRIWKLMQFFFPVCICNDLFWGSLENMAFQLLEKTWGCSSIRPTSCTSSWFPLRWAWPWLTTVSNIWLIQEGLFKHVVYLCRVGSHWSLQILKKRAYLSKNQFRE